MAMSVKRKSSRIWEFFTPIDNEMAKCDLCKNSFSYRTSVSNLKRHMERKHATISLEPKQVSSSVHPQPQQSQKLQPQQTNKLLS